MSNTVEKICVTMVCGEFIVGVLANGFIGMMNCMDWVKTRKFSYLNFMLIGLAISRIGLLGIIAFCIFLISFYPSIILSKMRNLRVVWILANNFSAWFSACLNVFYFLKITNFSHPISLWLKWKIDRGVLSMLLGCVFFSFLTSLTVILSDTFQVTYDPEDKINLTQKIQEYNSHICPTLVLLSMGRIVPFALSMISCLLLVLSLCRHTWHMQFNAMTSRDLSIEAHVKVMKAIVFFLFIFVLYYAGMFSTLSNVPQREKKLSILFTLVGIAIYPLAHSIILIVAHNRLRLAILRVLWKLRVCFKG